MRPVGELSKEIESVAAGESRPLPLGGRLALALGLAMLAWAVPLFVFYLLW